MFQFLKRFFGSPPSALACFGRTDTGMVRKNNEDNFAILVDKNLFLVADGMGGHQAGEVASRVAIEALITYFSEEKIRQIQGNAVAIQYDIVTAFHTANEKVMGMAQENREQQGMGCTLIACLIDGDCAYICHVGDVRGYIVAEQQMKQITNDHSLVADQQLDLPDGTEGVGRNIITRGIGFPFPEDPEFHQVDLQPGHKILLCSDGLWGMVADEEMLQILGRASSPEEACDDLVRQANAAGGKDNITAVVIHY